MPNKETKPKYPNYVYMRTTTSGHAEINKDLVDLMSDSAADEAEVAIYQFFRLAKVRRTVTVE